ncbi:MAG: 50S ribosomal protein L11 methyltransferase [Wenzhouxiangellaceae bacterium]|jgi:ribosomal protein L11 methyltransferase|nr:50S ribosomal protein L11 methyltransferase [Wenzhouxiangellaceae bacterium]MBS3824552.1 50S ribosomal protein L11 methyltransferase [Wenzhouxiangellaceae bacterium]
MANKLRFIPADGNAEAAEDALWELGALAVTLQDAGDQPLHEPGPGETPLWEDSIVEALLPDEIEARQALLALAAAQVISSPAEVQFEPLAERDWERAWMDRFEPMRFGESIWICPSHVEPDPGWDVVVRLDPGLAFGTGTHPTTALCLEWMDGVDFRGCTVIDYGCGSGVLAVVAALKGAEKTFAVDHDPQALTATRDNAERNGVSAAIETALPDAFEDIRADIVLANILAGPLIELSDQLCAHTRPGGWLVLSGILAGQADEVENAYAPLPGPARRVIREDWVRLDFRR